MESPREAYLKGYRVGQKDEYVSIAERLRGYAESQSEQAAYEDQFTGEPHNYVQDLREEMPIEYESARDGELAHAWDSGAFDALIGRSKNPPAESQA